MKCLLWKNHQNASCMRKNISVIFKKKRIWLYSVTSYSWYLNKSGLLIFHGKCFTENELFLWKFSFCIDVCYSLSKHITAVLWCILLCNDDCILDYSDFQRIFLFWLILKTFSESCKKVWKFADNLDPSYNKIFIIAVIIIINFNNFKLFYILRDLDNLKNTETTIKKVNSLNNIYLGKSLSRTN